MNICMLCNMPFAGASQTVRITDDKTFEKIDITGHISCTESLWKKVKAIENLKSKRLNKIIEELGLEHMM